MKKFLFRVCMIAVSGLLLGGCTNLSGDGFDLDTDTDEGAQAVAAGRLNNDPMTASATLSVSVEDGLGILYGTVPNEMVRVRALQILEGTPGIYEVLDRTRKR